MKKFLRIYWAYATAFIKARLEYRSTCITGMFANFYCYFITYLLLAVLAWKFGDIAGWDFSELSILYGLNLVSYAVAGMMFWNSTLDLEDTIVRGRLDRHLTRPMGVLQQLVLQTFGYTFLGQIAVAGLFLVRAYIRLSLCSLETILYSVYALVGSIFFQSAAMIFFGSIAFWTVRAGSLSGVLYYDIRELTNYPISIYPKVISAILTFVLPWALINYYPSLIILGRATPADGAKYWIGVMAPMIGCLAFVGAYMFFYRGLKRYESTGT